MHYEGRTGRLVGGSQTHPDSINDQFFNPKRRVDFCQFLTYRKNYIYWKTIRFGKCLTYLFGDIIEILWTDNFSILRILERGGVRNLVIFMVIFMGSYIVFLGTKDHIYNHIFNQFINQFINQFLDHIFNQFLDHIINHITDHIFNLILSQKYGLFWYGKSERKRATNPSEQREWRTVDTVLFVFNW